LLPDPQTVEPCKRQFAGLWCMGDGVWAVSNRDTAKGAKRSSGDTDYGFAHKGEGPCWDWTEEQIWQYNPGPELPVPMLPTIRPSFPQE